MALCLCLCLPPCLCVCPSVCLFVRPRSNLSPTLRTPIHTTTATKQSSLRPNHCHYACSVDGLAVWFDVSFAGSASTPAPVPTTLSTHPDHGYQHWGHQLALFPTGPLVVQGGDAVVGVMDLLRHPGNYRMYNLHVDVSVDSSARDGGREAEAGVTDSGDSDTSTSTTSSLRTGELMFEVP